MRDHLKREEKEEREKERRREKDYFLGFLDFLDRFGV